MLFIYALTLNFSTFQLFHIAYYYYYNKLYIIRRL
nr:MAG TPA: hypothetical protein [Microviridae sp.]